ncbi:sugar ABC transporter permease [Dietzia alimentaria]|jgi:multiple sugar transport system permease protein|uniref:carbohydrate ABC transporter permease n=1 Tax=Actinomycetes TaxID=1760 RepID=UPI000848682F|nr:MULTISPECIES: carbohydrate ABC transporter permease [Actinomycetes]MAO82008.1 carbohydrate ABC transporter permease [Nocardioides sp.]ODQ97093.1 sugar ABC transporter permease [Dietzia alimentaria]MBB1020766.1 carbohydrate ABC transporter permease [Dietzia sp. E1]MBB1054129.1 carbohydrate ABC transporter permease [Dietzia sp. B44]MEE1622766.1 carbohydrate ABC transporter permease [Zafaria sp. J156]
MTTKISLRRSLSHSLRWLLALVAITISVFPVLWMLRLSLSPADEAVLDGIQLLPSSLDWGNYARAWESADLGHAMLNGALVTGSILIIQIITVIPAGYAFAKLRFRGRDAAFAVILACLLVPTQATALPLYLGIGSIGLANTFAALVLPFMTSAIGIFMLRQHMITIPDSLLEAAKADGLGTLRTLVHVVVPSSMPTIAAFAVLSVFTHWNDYLWPLLVARDPSLYTPPLALSIFQQAETGTAYGELAAAAMLVTLPIVVLFIVAQRKFVTGIAGGELPG